MQTPNLEVPMASKNGIEVAIEEVVRVEITGRTVSKGSDRFGRNDDGLISGFREWQEEKKFTSFFIAYSGAGRYVAYFNRAELQTVKAFFKEKGFEVE